MTTTRLNSSTLLTAPNVTSLLFGGRKVPFCLLLEWDPNLKQWAILQQQVVHVRMALAESIPQVRVNMEEEADPVAG